MNWPWQRPKRPTATIIVHPSDARSVEAVLGQLRSEGYDVQLKTDSFLAQRGKMLVLRTPDFHDLDLVPYDYSWRPPSTMSPNMVRRLNRFDSDAS